METFAGSWPKLTEFKNLSHLSSGIWNTHLPSWTNEWGTMGFDAQARGFQFTPQYWYATL